MYKYQLSILIAGIRPKNWYKLYQSIQLSFSGEWEIIFVGPYPLPRVLKQFDNIQYVEDWGSPIRGLQIALTKAQGEYVSIAADDGTYLKGMLDEVFDVLKEKGYPEKHIMVCKYFEGTRSYVTMSNPEYYRINFHKGAKCRWIPDRCLLMNMMVAPRNLLWDMGGWDCEFEVPAMALCDLSVRVSLRDDIELELSKDSVYYCNFMNAEDGDHKPIHDAQTDMDMPRFKSIWDGDEKPERLKIPLDNWKDAPDRWVRRFGEA